MPTKLMGVSETLLIPLWVRAVETQRPDPIIRDEKAVEIMENIDYDLSTFGEARISQVGVSIRTRLLDDAISDFIRQHPDAVVVNLGAGLDTRFERMDNGTVRWYDLDLPEGIDLKRLFFEESDRYRFIAKSVLDFSWMDEVHVSDEPLLIIAEDLLTCFEEREIKSIFETLATRFPDAEMLVEMPAPKNGQGLESWNEKIELIKEWLLPAVKTLTGQRIVHLRVR